MPKPHRLVCLVLTVALLMTVVPAYGVSASKYNAVAFDSPDIGLMGGLKDSSTGIVYRVGSNGSLVSSASVGTLPVLGLDVSGSDAWAVTLGADRPLFSEDFGATWSPSGSLVHTGIDPSPLDVEILSSGRVVVVGQSKGVSDQSGNARGDLAFINVSSNGTTWTNAYEEPMETGFEPGVIDIPIQAYSMFTDVAESPSGGLAIAVGSKSSASSFANNTILKTLASRSTDGGQTWSNTTTLPPVVATYQTASAVTVPSDEVAFAFRGTYPHYWKTSDGGITWSAPTVMSMGTSYFKAHAADSRDPNTIVVVGEGSSTYFGTIVYSKNGGATWTRVPSTALPNGNATPDFYDVEMITDTHWVAVGDNNYILITRDAGATWSVPDFTPPVINISGVAQGASYTATVTPSISITGQTTQTITLDGARYVSGTPIFTDGTHTLSAVASDAAGNVATKTVTFDVAVDRTPPVIEVAGVTNGSSYGATVTPIINVSGQTTHTITLDGNKFVSGTPVSAEGTHTLSVWARDANGNQALSNVVFGIVGPPAVTITGVTDGMLYNTNVTPTVTISGQQTYELTLDGALYVSGTPITSETSHTLFASATNRIGVTVSKQVSFRIDKTAPVIIVSGVQDGFSYTTTVTPTVFISGQINHSITLDGQPFVSGTPISTDGTHTLSITASDDANNFAARTFTFGVQVDRTPPTIAISGVLDGASYAATVTPTVSISGQSTQTVTLDGQPFISGTPVSADGTHTLSAWARDTNGNSASTSVTFGINKTKPAPTVSITGVSGNELRNTPVTPVVTISGEATHTITLDGSPYATGTPIASEGEHTLAVVAVNSDGITTSRQVTFTIDMTPPSITISDVVDGAVYYAAVTPSISVSGDSSRTVLLDGQPYSPGTPISAEGSRTLQVSASDLAGNVRVVARSFAIKWVPVPHIASQPATLTAYDQTYVISGTVLFQGEPAAGQKVELWTSSTGAPGSFKKSSYAVQTAAGGTFSFTMKPRTITHYAVRSASSIADPDPLWSNSVKVVPQVSISNPYAPSTMYRTRYYTVYGYLKPRHTAGTKPVKIFRYRLVSGKWKQYGTYVWAKASNYSSYTKYSASVKLPYAGRWRLRAYHAADAGQPAKWSSGYDYVTVK